MAITETWLDSSFKDFELGLDEHVIHRKNRQERGGCGVLLPVHISLISIRKRDIEIEGTEIVMAQIHQKSMDNVWGML